MQGDVKGCAEYARWQGWAHRLQGIGLSSRNGTLLLVVLANLLNDAGYSQPASQLHVLLSSKRTRQQTTLNQSHLCLSTTRDCEDAKDHQVGTVHAQIHESRGTRASPHLPPFARALCFLEVFGVLKTFRWIPT